ncbi:tyrosine-type recombinase/integrase [Aurantiacibacter flavus]|uniref:tyrosine-type recombinase/integrase n=1 Tax=Aurantiacibacter flavus TaxID=3145232 RepID=UPI003D1E0AFC
MLRAIVGYFGKPETLIALKIAPHVFVRPGELRKAEWHEFDLEGAVWRIPGENMKMAQPHSVPLSSQVVELLGLLRALPNAGSYLFPAFHTTQRCMSENTLNSALRRLGYGGDEMTSHGFRAVASTLLNESGLWHPDAMERSLAHKDPDQVRAAYHRGAHWAERVRMMQWWSDHLEQLRDGAKIFTPVFRRARILSVRLRPQLGLFC